jgi:hypothetical protein
VNDLLDLKRRLEEEASTLYLKNLYFYFILKIILKIFLDVLIWTILILNLRQKSEKGI